LALVTVFIAFLGYSKWRRQRIVQEAGRLEEFGVFVSVPSDTRDYIWQRRPMHARIQMEFEQREWGVYGLGNRRASVSKTPVLQRLNKLGVGSFTYAVNFKGQILNLTPDRDRYDRAIVERIWAKYQEEQSE
jgi:hypothetical protein